MNDWIRECLGDEWNNTVQPFRLNGYRMKQSDNVILSHTVPV